MNDPAVALFRHAMDDDIYLQYIDDHKEFWANRKACVSACDKLRALLDEEGQKLFEILLDEQMLATSIETEAAFTAGLAFGLQLLRLS